MGIFYVGHFIVWMMGKKLKATSYQVMRCTLFYDNVVNILNVRTKKRKWLIIYYKTYGIIVLKKM